MMVSEQASRRQASSTYEGLRPHSGGRSGTIEGRKANSRLLNR